MSEPRQPIYSEAYYLPHSDRIEVKIRHFVPDEASRSTKRGILLFFSEEVLFNMAQGMEYCHKVLPDGQTRFQAIIEDMPDKPVIKEAKPSGIVYDAMSILKSFNARKHLKSLEKYIRNR